MTDTKPRLWAWHWPHEYNQTTALLVALTVLVQVVAIGVAVFGGWNIDLPATSSVNPTNGLALGGSLVLYSLILVALVVAWRKVPKKIRDYCVWGFNAVGASYIIWHTVRNGWWQILGLFAAGILGIIVLTQATQWPFWWLPFNIAGLALGAAVAAVVGSTLPPFAVLGLFAVMALWDEIAVNWTPLMKILAGGLASPLLPNVIVIPDGWRMDLPQVLADAMNDDTDTDARSLIGVGDFAIPGMLAVSAYLSFGAVVAALAIVGTAIGMIELHSTVIQTDRAHPGLPNLCGGAFAGFVVGLAGVAVV